MSWAVYYTIFCDESGCPEWVAQEPNRLEASATARSYGWQVTNGHYCPKHRKDKK